MPTEGHAFVDVGGDGCGHCGRLRAAHWDFERKHKEAVAPRRNQPAVKLSVYEPRAPEGKWFFITHGPEGGATVYCEMWFNDREDDARTEELKGVREVLKVPGEIEGALNSPTAVAARICAVMNACQGVPTEMLGEVVAVGMASKNWQERRRREEDIE